MKLIVQNPKKSLNKAYLKEKVSRTNIELFKKNLTALLARINEEESEEHLKNVISDFLKDTWYKELHEINTKDRKDLVIHTGKTTKESVGVILEVKKPSNKTEMISASKPNTKAMHELILYYLRERTVHNNIDIKYLVITNIYEWYIIDEVWFEKNVYRNSKLKKDYENWKHSGNDTRFFYDSIAKPFLDSIEETIPCTYFDVREYENIIHNEDKKDDSKLIALYKILSPVHLLKQPFANDSNSLDTKFYAELLHILGLEEVKEGSKKLIKRKEKPDAASLLENTIIKLEDKDCLRNISNISAFGSTKQEQLFNIALELCITWVNRVLFLKLLEAQLSTYHKGNKDYLFLNTQTIFDFDELSNLFFQVLAEKPSNRRKHVQEKFSKVPYLNSSLFERTELERQSFDISALDNRLELSVHDKSVLKKAAHRTKTGTLPVLQYFFEFLDAYDFSAEGSEEIQEENKNLINASVLGLIFEKINGYKDGSFFTPGFVTMYMCKETIRRAVVQKFNEAKGWKCENLENLFDKVDDKKEANAIINSLKICDPAVGSGHFLVSALNEIIAIKSELKILLDRKGKTLRDYQVEVVNDELIVTNDDGLLFDYKPKNDESQRIQEAIFHEKEIIIENCLFGVDINPNSVKICRLRLWIELLKSAYYTEESHFTELETLPNIDINIKCGNSLISRFALDADLSKALKKSKWNIDSYRIAVQTYRNAETKEQKRSMEQLIDDIKSNFRSEISDNDPKVLRKNKLGGELYNLLNQKQLFDQSKAEQKIRKQKQEKLEKEINKIATEIDEIKSNKIYENAFEWRFEFPEVLDGDGNFIGFDVVIGNPPYVVLSSFSDEEFKILQNSYSTAFGRINTFAIFTERVTSLLSKNAISSLIIPDSLCNIDYYLKLRKYLLDKYSIIEIIELGDGVFDEAVVPAIIFSFSNSVDPENIILIGNKNSILGGVKNTIPQKYYHKTPKFSYNLHIDDLFVKIQSLSEQNDVHFLKDIAEIKIGICTGNNNKYISDKPMFNNSKKVLQGRDINRYSLEYNNLYVNYDRKELLRAREESIFLNEEKLLMRQTSDKLILTYDNSRYYTIDSLFIISSDKIDLKYLLGLLNSKLLNRQYQKLNPEQGRVFAQVKIDYVNELPIKISKSEISKFVKIVDKILTAKKQDPKMDTRVFEKEIDRMVYELYELTEEEIKIIESQ